LLHTKTYYSDELCAGHTLLHTKTYYSDELSAETCAFWQVIVAPWTRGPRQMGKPVPNPAHGYQSFVVDSRTCLELHN